MSEVLPLKIWHQSDKRSVRAKKDLPGTPWSKYPRRKGIPGKMSINRREKEQVTNLVQHT
jgi:hypothetical protein